MWSAGTSAAFTSCACAVPRLPATSMVVVATAAAAASH